MYHQSNLAKSRQNSALCFMADATAGTWDGRFLDLTKDSPDFSASVYPISSCV